MSVHNKGALKKSGPKRNDISGYRIQHTRNFMILQVTWYCYDKINEVIICWTGSLDMIYKKYIQNFGGETLQ
jgi:hypothetical protein